MKSAAPATTSTASATTPPGSSSATTAIAPDPDALIDDALALLHNARTRLQAPAPAPGLALAPIEVAALEAALGVSVPLTPATLVSRVQALTSLKLGDVRIPFTPGQLAELNHRAQKRGRTLDQEIRAVVDRLRDELFYQGG